MNCNYFLPFFLFFLQSLIFRNLIFHKNKKKYKLYFQFEAKKNERKNKWQKCLYCIHSVPQNLIRKPSHLKKSGHFSNLEKKNLCVKKKSFATKI